MKLLISLASYPDVDHMPGKRTELTETIHDKYNAWKKHADAINSKFHNDDAEIVNGSNQEIYSVGNVIFARWDKSKRLGTVNLKGNQLSK